MVKSRTAAAVTISLLLVLFLSPGTGLAQINQPAGTPGVTGQEIFIGTWAPQTGLASPWGSVARGTDTYFKMVNKKGGIHGRWLRLLTIDDQNKPPNTLKGVRELVEDRQTGVFGFVGGVGTINGLTVMDYLVERGIPWVGMATGASQWAYPPKSNIFAVYPLYRDEGAILTRYAVEVLGHKNIAIIYQADEFGEEGRGGIMYQLKQYNLQPVADISVEAWELDMKPATDQLAAAAPEVVIMWLMPTQAVQLRRQAGKSEFSPVWMTGSALADAKTMERMTSHNWAGTIFTFFGELPDSNSPLMVEYQKAYETLAVKGERWGPFFYTGFGLAEPMVAALKLCPPGFTRPEFLAQMESLKDFKGILGNITYGPHRRQGQRSFFLCQARRHGRISRLTDWINLD